MAGGRPTTYSDDVADEICALIAEGWSVRQICMRDEMPVQGTFYRWLLSQPWLQKKYALAKEAQADLWSDEIIDIADDASNDWMERERRDGSKYEVVNEEVLGRSRLRIETRKWLMGKNRPKKYGDRIAVGGDEDMPPIQTQQTINVAVLTVEQLEALTAALTTPLTIEHDDEPAADS